MGRNGYPGGFFAENKHCTGCIFKAGTETCDFLIRTGRRRAPICPPGKGCKLKSGSVEEYRKKWAALFPGTEAPLLPDENSTPDVGAAPDAPELKRQPTEYDLRRAETRAKKKAEALKLLREGVMPKAIAEKLKCTPMTIYNMREELIAEKKLPPASGQAVRIDKTNARELWEAGQTDKEIAAAVGVYPKSIARWRCRHGLKPN